MKLGSGQAAVITGAASGIGLALAHGCAAAGMRLVMADLDGIALRRAREQVDAEQVLSMEVDVADGEAMERLAAETLATFGCPDLLCNNAGVGTGSGQSWELGAGDWQGVLGVNLWGVIHGVRVFLPHMVERNHGHVVNTSSVAGLMSVPGMAPYNVSKSAVVALSETMGAELAVAGSRVGVSVLCPSFVNTRIYESARPAPGNQDQTDEQTLEATRAFFREYGMSAEAVATQVLAAVQERRFYVFSHAEQTPERVRQRMEAMLRGELPDFSGAQDFPLR